MNRRLAVVTAGLVVAGLVGPGYAAEAAPKPKPAPKPVCLLLTDPTGDAKFQGQGNDYPADDIVSGDIATGKKTIVGVLRVVSGDTSTGFPTGSTYELEWTQTQKGADGKTTTVQSAFFLYVYSTGGVSGAFGSSSNPSFAPGATTPVAKTSMDANGVITWVMNRNDASVAKGAKFSQLSAATSVGLNYRISGGSGTSSSAGLDTATGHGTYLDGQASCVRAS